MECNKARCHPLAWQLADVNVLCAAAAAFSWLASCCSSSRRRRNARLMKPQGMTMQRAEKSLPAPLLPHICSISTASFFVLFPSTQLHATHAHTSIHTSHPSPTHPEHVHSELLLSLQQPLRHLSLQAFHLRRQAGAIVARGAAPSLSLYRRQGGQGRTGRGVGGDRERCEGTGGSDCRQGAAPSLSLLRRQGAQGRTGRDVRGQGESDCRLRAAPALSLLRRQGAQGEDREGCEGTGRERL